MLSHFGEKNLDKRLVLRFNTHNLTNFIIICRLEYVIIMTFFSILNEVSFHSPVWQLNPNWLNPIDCLIEKLVKLSSVDSR